MTRDSKCWGVALMLFFAGGTALAQMHIGNWVYKNSADTTEVRCWRDTMTAIGFPPSSMGMMMPSAMFVRIDKMPMDSLTIPHDSTFMGWYRVEAGTDSTHFSMMNDGGMGGGSMTMQFMRTLSCSFHYDSLMSDPTGARWHMTGVKGWNGSSWTDLNGASFSGSIANVGTNTAYSVIAFVGTSSVTAVSDAGRTPQSFLLGQNYPNPFNPSTTISYSLPGMMRVRLEVFNVLGQKVATLVDNVEQSGIHSVRFVGANLPSGFYFYRLEAGTFTETKRLVLLK